MSPASPLVLAAALVAMALTSTVRPAQAQTPDLDAARLNALEQQARDAQARALEAERESNAALMRLRTEQTLAGLADGRAASPAPGAGATTVDSRWAVDEQRIMQLRQEALARSNARILAVRPAL